MRNRLAKLCLIIVLSAVLFGAIGHAVRESYFAKSAIAKFSSASLSQSNSKRGQLYLNGVWQFIPVNSASEQQPPQSGWGSISVPGDWQRENDDSIPGVISRGTGKVWENFNGQKLAKAWYQRTVKIPEEWQGRSLFLDIGRVSTDAVVYVNGTKCGEVNWPYGAVDITKLVQPGQEVTLAVLVVAVRDEKEKTIIMGPNEVYTTEATLDSRGLIGEVRLLSLPHGPHVSDVFVQPSTRQKQVKLDVELADVTQAGDVQLRAKMLDEKGNVEREFTTTAQIQAKQRQTLQLVWDWPNPRLWDVGQPNLYTLQLDVKGSGIDDEYNQQFGFREFWIEGRKFYLNGTEIRLHPVLHDDTWQGWGVGIPEVADGMIDGYVAAGFNIAELWPWNHDERGRWHFRELFTDRADVKGFPIMAPAMDVADIASPKQWYIPFSKQVWEQRMATDLRRYRNHPSILLWASTPNYFGHSDDQNPRRIGKKTIEGKLNEVEDKRMGEIIPIGKDAVSSIKKYDPTRPVMMHQGATVGDVYALNSYLNMIPLQEREEWLSEWTQHGDMPYMVVEFGTPLHATMMRSRNGFAQAITSEPLMTEFSAIYLGKQAYELETSEYRSKIRESFVKDQEYQGWHGKRELDFAPAFQKLQQLFSTNTWRSWRTFGITGGMLPWSNGHGWEVSQEGNQKVDIVQSDPSGRGVHLKQVRKSLLHYFQPPDYIVHPGGEAILQNNAPTLAWIAGSSRDALKDSQPPRRGDGETGGRGEKTCRELDCNWGSDAAFAAKDHNFRVGEKLQKQIVLINDTRSRQEFSVDWQVVVNENAIAKGQKTGNIETAQTLFFPIAVDLPDSTDGKTANGEIRLIARISNRPSTVTSGQLAVASCSVTNSGSDSSTSTDGRLQVGGQSPRLTQPPMADNCSLLQDRFAFRVFPKLPKATGTLTVFDPVGKTTQMLQQLGYTVVPWNGSSTSQLLVIGREALSGGYKLPGDLEAFVRNGGRAIAFSQNPEWLQRLGFRVAPHLTRRVFPIDPTHPVVNGLDEQDLRDWTGESTLVAAYPKTLNGESKRSPHSSPWYGWHWGNRGAVSSASIEKPHRSSWRPILESEFDLAYTPLMELDYGKGRLIWNTLDLEDHHSLDAAVEKLAQQAIEYGINAPLSPKANKVILIGDDADKAKLDALGLIYQPSNSLQTDAELTIIGAKATINDEELRTYLNQGGKVFFLPRTSPSMPLGVRLHLVKNFSSLPSLPKSPEARGISTSDLHSRSDRDAWLIESGGDIENNGLLARISQGKGVAIFCQIDPDSLNADTKTYFRYTRWRQTRSLAQLLANLGGSFKADRAIFNLQQMPSTEFYHPDYRTDFDLGDDPYRYYRW